ncbi:hypothetical protein IFM89_021935 [Coptis chinensis]|uniref:Peptidylprolyl isomerase n=1 Tax=Coptis chinensis TaxID=261450 RepID=A0A835LK54_9MAGN|nr:hypothetical protein IFM89_021935 [Coptis chinensis]
MMRTSSSHLPSLKPSPLFLLTTFNFSSSSLNTHNSFSFCPTLPSLSLKQQQQPFFSTSAPSPLLNWSLTMMGSSSSKASFSTGSSEGGGGEREIMVQHLLVNESNLNLIVELQQKILGGEDLSDLATEHSICPSKQQGGMLGWVRKGQMVPEFEEAAFNAPLNKVVRCKTKFGWHLLQVLSERETSLQDIDPEELHLKMQDPGFLEEAQLIDVREPDEVDQASLPGFVVLPLRQFGSWSAEISTKFNPQKDTYVLCHHGVRSLQVAKWLQTQDWLVCILHMRSITVPDMVSIFQGFKRIFNVKGGIHAYAVKADPSVSTY